jgi:nicotinamide-nucleotide amidase
MPIFTPDITALARAVLTAARSHGIMIVTAESCTGGLIAAALTDIPGASQTFDRGFVVYANEAKSELLNIPPTLIGSHGAVSEPVAKAMAQGALNASHAALALSVTGIAGPDGGSAAKPVGLVWFAMARRGHALQATSYHFTGNRDEIRHAALHTGLTLLRDALERV